MLDHCDRQVSWDVFSLNDTEEVVVEVNVNDVPETGDVMPSEEEQLIEEQAP